MGRVLNCAFTYSWVWLSSGDPLWSTGQEKPVTATTTIFKLPVTLLCLLHHLPYSILLVTLTDSVHLTWEMICIYYKNSFFEIEAWKEEALDNLPWKAPRGPSTRRTLEPFQRHRWGNFWETGWSACGLFQEHRYHLELNWNMHLLLTDLIIVRWPCAIRRMLKSNYWLLTSHFSFLILAVIFFSIFLYARFKQSVCPKMFVNSSVHYTVSYTIGEHIEKIKIICLQHQSKWECMQPPLYYCSLSVFVSHLRRECCDLDDWKQGHLTDCANDLGMSQVSGWARCLVVDNVYLSTWRNEPSQIEFCHKRLAFL